MREIKFPPQSKTDGRTEARIELERRYAHLLEERLAYRKLVTYMPNKAEPVHGWFKFLQGFSPKLVELMLEELSAKPSDRVFDPFCGCGTTLLTAKQLGFSSWGIDILPIAVFVTEVKLRDASAYDMALLRRRIDELLASEYRPPSIRAPQDVRIIKLAYSEETLSQILFFKERILEERDDNIRDFLLFGLLAVLESVSYTSKDGQFLRLKPNKPIPSVRAVLAEQLNRMYEDLNSPHQLPLFGDLRPLADSRPTAYVELADARHFTDEIKDYADIIITSPPYLNRYDYSRIYSLELCLAFCKDFNELKQVRHSLLRSHIESREAPTNDVKHPALIEVLDNLKGQNLNNPRIPVMIKGYFEDMNLAIKELYKVCQPGARVALVVGNSRFHGELIPVDLLLSELAVDAGFGVERIIIARYKGNSSQQMGRYGRVPVRESISIWRKNV
jgi:DNA modification methylase